LQTLPLGESCAGLVRVRAGTEADGREDGRGVPCFMREIVFHGVKIFSSRSFSDAESALLSWRSVFLSYLPA
jgi:hypothetical protein